MLTYINTHRLHKIRNVYFSTNTGPYFLFYKTHLCLLFVEQSHLSLSRLSSLFCSFPFCHILESKLKWLFIVLFFEVLNFGNETEKHRNEWLLLSQKQISFNKYKCMWIFIFASICHILLVNLVYFSTYKGWLKSS